MQTTARDELVGACEDMRWRDMEDGLERLLSALSWWLETQDQTAASVAISGLRNSLEFNHDAPATLRMLLEKAECSTVDEIIDEIHSLRKENERLEGLSKD